MKKRKVFGKGVNDAPYKVTFTKADGKRGTCPFYARWTDMLRRCYCPKQLERMPSYTKTTVCEEWLMFSEFKAWMESQDWEDKVLDKDLLADGTNYSPSSCVFVPEYVNFAIMGQEKYRGVIFHNRDKVYQASIRCFGKARYLGSFQTEQEATLAYRQAKLEYLKTVLAMYIAEQGDQRVIKSLEVKIENLA